MNKTVIKNFAIDARKSLLQMVTDRAALLGITYDGKNVKVDTSREKGSDYEIFTSAGGINTILAPNQSKQRENLVRKVKAKGFEATMEEAAYTWFNRIIAIRFMEVNDYLPSRIRVLSSETEGKTEPDLVTMAPNVEELNLSATEKETIIELKGKNKFDEVFQLLFIKQCNELNKILPELFESTKTSDLDYTELLLSIRYTDANSVVRKIQAISEDDFREAVEIIGWLYQYYNTELKDDTFKKLKKNVKITNERIPAATQLFTPDWIVRYMVENTVLRSVSKEDKERVKPLFKYFIENEQSADVDGLEAPEVTNLKEIQLIDPCMGSGHILVCAFEVFMELYKANGYSERDAAKEILENNIFGLDIDRRAYQLTYFALMMKGRKYDRRFFDKEVKLNVYNIESSEELLVGSGELLVDSGEWLVGSGDWLVGSDEWGVDSSNHSLLTTIHYLIDSFKNAKAYGSLITLEKHDYVSLKNALAEVKSKIANNLEHDYKIEQIDSLIALCDRAELLSRKFQCVVTNPPYMGSSGMNETLSDYVKNRYPDSKSDLFACFIERCGAMSKGFYAMITQHAWMFLSSYEKLREKLQKQTTLNMAHLGARAFDEIGGEVVQTTSFVNSVKENKNFKGTYIRLVDYAGESEKEKEFLSGNNRFSANQQNFAKIPGSPVAYWVSEKELLVFSGQKISELANPKQGLISGDVNRFVRKWFECSIEKTSFVNDSNKKWFPYNNGGEFRRWFGNNEDVINWENNGFEILNFKDSKGKLRSRPQNKESYFKEGSTWSAITSGKLSVRHFEEGFLFSNAGMAIFSEKEKLLYLTGLLNSKITDLILNSLNPGLNFNAGDIAKIPIIFPTNNSTLTTNHYSLTTINSLVEQNIDLSKSDWDSFETSWDFVTHPFLVSSSNHSTLITNHYKRWQNECQTRFDTLKANEEELNRIFIDIYGLADELTPEVAEKDVTVRKAELERDVKSFVSYAVGCMLGRYSPSAPGVLSGEWLVMRGDNGNNIFVNEKEIYCNVCKELSRIDSLAKSDESGGNDLRIGEGASENGNVRTLGSDSSGCGFDTFKYSRGTSKELYKGICTISGDSERLEGGTGNPTYDLCSPEILGAIESGDGSELVRRGWKNAELIDWKALHSTLITNHFESDADNVIPVTDKEYFQDDIVSGFVRFVRTVFGDASLEENLKFIAEALGTKGDSPRQKIRAYFLNDFYKDHIKIYQKRPIYWMFDSGKENGFKALVYMHRYDKETCARVRTDYLFKQQKYLENALTLAQKVLENPISTAGDKKEAMADQARITKQLAELKLYDRALSHVSNQYIALDLDDGINVNYEKFQNVVVSRKEQGQKDVTVNLLGDRK